MHVIFSIRNGKEAQKKSLVTMTIKRHSQSFNMFCLNRFHHSKKHEQVPGRFSAMVQIYQSQLGKSSLPKGNQPHYHICTSLQLDWAFGVNRQPSFLTKLPFM